MELAETLAGEHDALVNAAATPQDALVAVARHYRAVRQATAPLDEDGDMLLFEWGTYGFDDAPERFLVLLTRQLLTPSEDPDEQHIIQVKVEFGRPPSARTDGLGSGEAWCSHPDEVDDFVAMIRTSPAFEVLADEPAEWRREAWWTEV
ncbi:MAG: hypothetical protein AAF211_25630 [Myxococcota bacterium]